MRNFWVSEWVSECWRSRLPQGHLLVTDDLEMVTRITWDKIHRKSIQRTLYKCGIPERQSKKILAHRAWKMGCCLSWIQPWVKWNKRKNFPWRTPNHVGLEPRMQATSVSRTKPKRWNETITCEHEYIRRITQCLEMNTIITDIKTQYTGKTENCIYTV